MIRADGKITGNISPIGSVSGGISAKGNIKGGMSDQIAWDYEKLKNLPSIEGHVLIGDQTFPQLGMDTLSVQDIEKILYLD